MHTFPLKFLCPCLVGVMLAACLVADAAPAATWKFVFDAEPATGWTKVASDCLYSASRGHGFEAGGHAVRLFSVALPEGNYDVTMTFGSFESSSVNTIKAESRRLMLERVVTRPREFVTNSFTVNIRTPEILGAQRVRIKKRESSALHWDEKLTLEFNGSHPAVRSVEITPATNAITVFLLGDSTVTDQPDDPWNSWGQMLPRFFQPGVAVANHAESGESLKSSISANRVKKVLTSMRSGDYLFVQFGHNDMKDRATNSLGAYMANLKQLVTDTRARGATPILITSMERMSGVERDTLAGYPQAVRDVAREAGVALIDLHAMSRELYRALGSDLKSAFQDGTHHNAYGSYELARCVVAGIQTQVPELAKWLAADVGNFAPAQPDAPGAFRVPPSSNVSNEKPEGN
jgi:lysophospholipase L1-like esterase